MRALQISAYGDPLKVLELVDVPEPGVPGAGEVLIDVELAPLNKHDLLFIRGFFGGPPTPTVVGNEGFGRVAAVGPGVANVKVGEHVLAPIFGLTWRERLIAPAQGLFPLPDGDRLQFAQLGSNPPTAALILSEYADLKPGDWVAQNGGNSGVGLVFDRDCEAAWHSNDQSRAAARTDRRTRSCGSRPAARGRTGRCREGGAGGRRRFRPVGG